jgi:hypothetical protein
MVMPVYFPPSSGGGSTPTTLWRFTGAAGTKTLLIDFGGTTYYTASQSATNLCNYTVETIRNRNATNSQISAASNLASFAGSTQDVVTSAVDTTSAVTLTWKGQLANAADSIAIESYLVELIVPGF